MSVMQVVATDLTAMEEKFGVSAAAAAVAGPAAGAAVEEQTEFNVIPAAAGANKVAGNQSSTWRNWPRVWTEAEALARRRSSIW